MTNATTPGGVETAMESGYVPTDATGPKRWGIPQAGQFVLIPNAGGNHQSPGSYGYTRTEVLDVEHKAPSGLTSWRITTRAFGQGCWGNEPAAETWICVVDERTPAE